jgi:dATP pyrophosphohydrolase
MKKIPISVLVLIHTKNKEILILKKKNDKDLWQSVTGSLNENETPIQAAKREVFEETGLNAENLIDCEKQYIFEIYEMWKHKYEWVTRVKAAEKVFSHTNRQAIFDLI